MLGCVAHFSGHTLSQGHAADGTCGHKSVFGSGLGVGVTTVDAKVAGADVSGAGVEGAAAGARCSRSTFVATKVEGAVSVSIGRECVRPPANIPVPSKMNCRWVLVENKRNQ